MKLSEIVSLDQLRRYDKQNFLQPGNSLLVASKYIELEDKLYEGLITSYPLQKIIETIHSKLECKTRKLRKDHKSFYNCFSIVGLTEEMNFKQLLSILNLGGWYIALANLYDGKTRVAELRKNITLSDLQNGKASSFEMKVEARFDIQIDRKYWPNELYCLAPSKVRNKIEKIGLVPKSGNNLDNQPERIYLGFDSEKLISEMLPQLKRKDKRYDDGVILVAIDTKKLPSNVRLFDDINWPEDAVFAIVNIPYYCIKNIKELENESKT